MAFTRFKTPDGRWEYGTGEYEKTLSSYLGVSAPRASSSVPGKLVDALFPQKKQLQAMTYSAVSSIRIPTFYIWAQGPDQKKRIAEWPFAKSLRDAAYAGFVPAMRGQYVTDLQRVKLISQLQSTAGSPSMTNLAPLAAIEKQMLVYDEIDKRVRHTAAEEVGGVFLVLAAAAALGLFIALR